MSLLNAADVLRREANRFKELSDAADRLGAMGSLEQAEEEAKRTHSQAVAAASKAKEELAKVMAQLQGAQKAGDEIIANARKEAVNILAATNMQIAAKHENAEAHVNATIQNGRDKANALIDEAGKQEQAALARKRDIDVLTKQTMAERDSAHQELDELTARIDKVKDEIKRLLG